jgi:RNA recognition motif-containing protein
MDDPTIPLSNTTTELLQSSVVDPILLSTKRVIYVGGLPNATTIPMLRAAFIPFGTINSIDMVRTTNNNKLKLLF